MLHAECTKLHNIDFLMECLPKSKSNNLKFIHVSTTIVFMIKTATILINAPFSFGQLFIFKGSFDMLFIFNLVIHG